MVLSVCRKVMVLVAAALLAAPVQGQAGGIAGNQFTNGGDGIKTATAPPPGTYYRFYNFFYTADRMRDGSGDKMDIDFDVFVYANVHRLIHFPGWTVLGGDFFSNIVIPVVYTDLKIGAAGIREDDFSLGDIFVEPVALAWHGERWDAAVGIGVWVPTGYFDKDQPASPGKDYWSGMFSAGATVYLDAAKTWSVSALGRYEIHGKRRGVDLTPGDDFHFEWGIGKALPKDWKIGPLQFWEAGVAGYAQWQVTDDRGRDIDWDKSVHDRVFAVGPEIRCMIPAWKTVVELRSLKEFGAVDRSEGVMTALVLTKAF
jgi:hypothetical protein